MQSEIEKLKYSAQRCLQGVPSIVIGSGYSAGYGLPTVGQLSKFLIDNLKPTSKEEGDQWEQFKKLSEANTLEQALQKIGTLNHDLLNKIVRLTWQQIATLDAKVRLDSIRDPRSLALYRLIEYLFSSSQNAVSIVSTNYDLLCEYSISSFGAFHCTGFLPGMIGNREDNIHTTYLRGGFPARTVNLWKVHGSLDWFSFGSGIIRADLSEVPEDFVPQIITPGIEKYQRALKEPFRTVLSGADQALSNATSFLCIGYGFNDEHIQEKLVDRINRYAKPICILAMQLTPATKSFLAGLKTSEYIAIEKNANGSIAYTNQFPGGVEMPGEEVWSLSQFLKWSVDR